MAGRSAVALALAVAALCVASAFATCSNAGGFVGEGDHLDYSFEVPVVTDDAAAPAISVTGDVVTFSVGANGVVGRQASAAKVAFGDSQTGVTTTVTCEGTGDPVDPTDPASYDFFSGEITFPNFVAAGNGDTRASDGDVDGAAPWSGNTEIQDHYRWTRTASLTFTENMKYTRNGNDITTTRTIVEDFVVYVSAPKTIVFDDEDLIEIFDTPLYNILLTGYEVDYQTVSSTTSDPATTYTITITTIIQKPFKIASLTMINLADNGDSPAGTETTGTGGDTVAAVGTYNKQSFTFTIPLSTCGTADEVNFAVTVGCNNGDLGDDNCPIDNDPATAATNTWDMDPVQDGEMNLDLDLPFDTFCTYVGGTVTPYTITVTTWDASIAGGCGAASPMNTDDFVDGDTVCFRGVATSPDVTVSTLTCDSVAAEGGASVSAKATVVDSTATCQYKVNQAATGNTDTSTEYDFDITFTVTYVTTAKRLRSKRRSLLTTETTTASTTLQISANSNQAAGVGVGVGGVTGTSSGSSLGVVVGAIMGAAVLITLAVFVGVVIVLRKSPSDDRSRSNARYNAGGAPEVTPIVIQLNGGNNGAKKTKAAASRPMARVVPDESSTEADNMTSSTAAYSSAESSSAADYSSTAASTDYVSSSYV